MVRVRVAGWAIPMLLSVLLTASAASAQQASGIAGVVKDSSGAVLPGVTVEAASPALIEKVRTVVTDEEGRYNVVDLRPGTYTVTFTLSGFSTFRREGIVLPAGFTATVNADLQLGALEETITVTGEAPLVDTQNVRQQTAVSNELISTLPAGSKGIIGLGRVIPGLTLGEDTGAGGAQGIYQANTPARATIRGRGGAKLLYDGMQVNNLAGTGGSVTYIPNPSTAEEVVIETGGISAESDSSGISFNMIPKEGGNVLHGNEDFTFTNQHLQTDNLTDTMRERGVSSPGRVLHSYDVNLTVGGPIRQDRLWFFAATRVMGTKNEVAGKYFNATQGTPFYTPDLDRPQFRKDWLRSQAVRLTWQLTPKNKLNVFADPQRLNIRGTGDNQAPESQTCWAMKTGTYQGAWTAPVTNRWLLEAGAALTKGPFPCTIEQVTEIFDFIVRPTDVAIQEASTGLWYNAKSSYSPTMTMDRYVQRFSASYVTGSHSYKAGFQLQQHIHDESVVRNMDVTYRFNRGVPIRLTQWATPWEEHNRTKADLGLYVQDQWAIKRLTLNYGLRFSYFNGYVPPQRVPAGQFVGARDFDRVDDTPNWKDLDPRVGGSYDLFGTGRTALKASLGRYVGRHAVQAAELNNPIATSVNSANRAWNDINANFTPDCDLTNFAANGECGPIDNINFGQINPNAIRYDDDLIRGWGKRDYVWDLTAEIQHELRPGLSLTGGYYRNWSDHFPAVTGAGGQGWQTSIVEDNLAVTPDDYSPFCITAPVDPRLPGGGGYEVCGLYDIAPAKFGVVELLGTRASKYGGMSRVSDFVAAGINGRFDNGMQFSFAIDSGRTVEDQCYVIDSPQQLLNCRTVRPFQGQTQIKAHLSYPLPGEVVVSGILQNVSGASYWADYQASNAEIAPSLGRNLAACGTRAVCSAAVTVPLIQPWTQFEPRRTLLDLRLSKIFVFGAGTRLRANVDLYNALNTIAITHVNQAYGSRWLQPNGPGGGIVMGRLVNVGAQLTF